MNEVGSSIEHRLRHAELRALLAYWRRAGQGAIPSRSDIEPTEIPELLSHLMLVDVERAPIRFRARLCGTAIDRTFGRSFTGRYLDDINAGYFDRDALQDYAAVVFCKQPRFASRNVVGGDGHWLQYQRLLLPLSSDGWQINMLLGGVCAMQLRRADHADADPAFRDSTPMR